MAHSLESTIRDAYAAFECGDVDENPAPKILASTFPDAVRLPDRGMARKGYMSLPARRWK